MYIAKTKFNKEIVVLWPRFLVALLRDNHWGGYKM
jgi:hypothetical protein